MNKVEPNKVDPKNEKPTTNCKLLVRKIHQLRSACLENPPTSVLVPITHQLRNAFSKNPATAIYLQ